MRQGEIWVNNQLVGVLIEDDTGYRFKYRKEYLEEQDEVVPDQCDVLFTKKTARHFGKGFS